MAAIGIVSYRPGEAPDAALAEAVRRLRARGLRVGGLLQHGESGDGSCCAVLYLTDIETGRCVRIYDARAAGGGCRLDPAGLADAASWLRAAVDRRPDLLFVNRFGRQEADGRGLLSEIAAAALADIPVVIPVSAALLPVWHAFAGTADVPLPSGADALEAWCLAQVPAAAPAPLEAAC